MRLAAVLTAVLLLATVASVPPASASGFSCAVLSPGPWIVKAFSIPPPYNSAIGAGACGAATFTSSVPDCGPPASVGPVPGAWCGPMVLPGQTIRCTASIGPTERLAIGLDAAPYDGAISFAEGPVRYNWGTGGQAQVQASNAAALPVRAILYPIITSPLAGVSAGCVVA